MPRNPNAIKPKANTAAVPGIMSAPTPRVLTYPPAAIRARIAMPSQYALKLPATRPERILSDGPPSRDEVTTSRTCLDSTEVNTFTNSGMRAPASVPQLITVDSFHHNEESPPSAGIIIHET